MLIFYPKEIHFTVRGAHSKENWGGGRCFMSGTDLRKANYLRHASWNELVLARHSL